MVNGDFKNPALERAHNNYTPTHGLVDASCDKCAIAIATALRLILSAGRPRKSPERNS